jgi:transcriptional regulator with XRE-family HTH domain
MIISKLLSAPGETQTKLAKAIGVNRQSIGQWKDGITSPDINALYKIADYYNVSADYLIGRTSKQDEQLKNQIKGELQKAIDTIDKM